MYFSHRVEEAGVRRQDIELLQRGGHLRRGHLENRSGRRIGDVDRREARGELGDGGRVARTRHERGGQGQEGQADHGVTICENAAKTP